VRPLRHFVCQATIDGHRFRHHHAITVAAIYGLIAIAVSITWSVSGLSISPTGSSSPSPAMRPGWSRRGCRRAPFLIAGAGILAGAVGGIINLPRRLHPLHDKPAFTSRGMIATLAISLIGSQVFLMIFGPTSKSTSRHIRPRQGQVFRHHPDRRKIGIVVCSITMLIGVVLWMRSSRRGLEIRAMMMNPHAASIVGIGIRRTGLYVMALTGAMAGLASVLLSQTYYIAPFSGLRRSIKGVSIALCGGLVPSGRRPSAAILLVSSRR